MVSPQPALDLTDIQGNILRGYGFPFSRYLFCRILDPSESHDGLSARRTISGLIPDITTSEWWRGEKPQQTLNIAISYPGLQKLKLPAESLAGFPFEFQEGMLKRSINLNHVRKNSPEHWETIWRQESVDLLLVINALSEDAREQMTSNVQARIEQHGGILILGSQDGAALVVDGEPTKKEHFGYTDGIGNPDILGSGIPARPGRGVPVPGGKWEPVKTGEFLLGYLDEGGEVPASPRPHLLSRNSSFLVYLKLHQNVAAFREFTKKQAEHYPGGEELVKAKMIGRWDDGTPMQLCPFHKDASVANDPMRNNDFSYADDPDGTRVPLGSHVRRMNPRDTFGFDGRLACRHRIARRGLPYGKWVPYDQTADDTEERGINFMVVNASINRQFEFVWKEWVNYGNDFGLGNDRDPIMGNHTGQGSMVIPGDPERPEAQPAHFLTDIPQFVELRGGGYFFLPSLTALRLIAQGRVMEELSTYDPAATLPPAVDTPAVPPPDIDPPRRDPTDAMKPQSFWAWLSSLPSRLFAAVGAWISAAMSAWIAKHQLTFFWLLRTFKPIFKKGDVYLVARYRDVVEVLNAKQAFFVTYGEKMSRLTNGGEFFLGMQPSETYERDVSNMREATRRTDAAQIIVPSIQQSADAIIKKSEGHLNVATDLGLIVPTHLTRDYLGITNDDDMRFAEHASLMFRYLFIPDNPPEVDAKALRAATECREAIDQQIQDQKKNPNEMTVLGRCLQMQRDGFERMDDVQIRSNLLGLLVGMIPTTAKCVAQALDQLLDRPQQLAGAQQAALANDDELLSKYVFEALRFNPQNPGLFRVVAEDYRLAGKRLPVGARVVALTWSAMFDRRELDSPNEFRIDRPASHYLHFGAGMHECFGQRISQLQIPGILKPLLQQPGLRRAEGDSGRLQMAGPFPSSLIVDFNPPTIPPDTRRSPDA
ncbi:cytochrome P450 [Neorhodopirellula pilleata]|uniref:Cytochrome P450-SU2 n=1 Tax=Neorhodopirellula pilleata TaxID=2714738 RepID=A0A5C6ADB4_9BACT|nr:cytochrome P450 [Neorhodopirellula pilleata]TWT97406.1 Cytochrome P450-SU2 [Neorhodopirellula pilleata]